MKKLSEYKNEEALIVLADIMDPFAKICTDEEFRKYASEKNVAKAAKVALKKNSKSVIEMMAVLEGVPVEKYECNILTLPKQILEIIHDKDLLDFFKSQGQELMESESLTSASESTTE